MTKIAEIFLIVGLLLFATGLHFVLPWATPYFILGLGAALCVLGGLGIVKGIRK